MAIDYKLALSVAKDNWNNQDWWRDEAVPFAKRTALSGTLKPYYSAFGPNGTDYMSEDWDNLLILDACRFDMFNEYNWIDGDLKKMISVGSSTPEFLQRTFKGKQYHDTVYVTSNPQVTLRLDSDVFYETVNVWESEWDDDLGTVRPEPVTQAAIDAQKQYPNKRLIVHYMQPHYPFIGDIGQNELEGHAGFELSKRLANNETADRDHKTIWDMVQSGEVPKSIVWDAYVENLEIVLDAIQPGLETLQGKTVITSDHGNLIGETATPFNLEMYGHPTGIHAKELVTVPWLSIDCSSRKKITHDDPESQIDSVNEEEIHDRLADLGYK
ncbi:hypothetical protein [Halalkalicoccus ordinarius]|uniref:hypothetical protein n=1 Tax=Halalkalicoccus ordinarius TaxID=3116651 RepID=UPI00300ED1A6